MRSNTEFVHHQGTHFSFNVTGIFRIHVDEKCLAVSFCNLWWFVTYDDVKGMCSFWHVYFSLSIFFTLMFIFHSLILTLTHIFHNFMSNLCFTFSPRVKTNMWHWGWGYYENISENQNCNTENKYIFSYNFLSPVNFMMKVWC